MGGLCSGVPGIPSAPEIDISAEDIASACTDAMSGIPQAILDNENAFRGEVNKCGDDGKYEVPDTNLVLTKASDDNAIHIAAITAAFATSARDAVKVMLLKILFVFDLLSLLWFCLFLFVCFVFF